MTTALDRYRETSERRRRRAERANIRLDIQGLRAVAILAVLAYHLWGVPQGGFVGIDVFFVISGFLVTDSLLRHTEQTGRVDFRDFYWNRVRRIVPAATIVLILTWAVSVYVLPPPGAREVGVDAVFAFFFIANWHFAAGDTSYLTAAEAVSPVQHYWALAVEEQFYLVWPALIFVATLVAVRKAWSSGRWMLLTGAVMGVVVGASLGWALYQSATSPSWAFFSTLTRVWELGIGAMLATAVGVLATMPDILRPVLSWVGLGLVGAGMVLIDGTAGFPAPWALLPVAGAAMVIAAGVGTEPKFQVLLRNRVSTYVGDLAYSLYLMHWPVIIFLTALMATSVNFYVCVLALTFGLAIASYHFVENPLRFASREAIRDARHAMRHGLFETQRSTKVAVVASLGLLAVALISYAMRPDAFEPPAPAEAAVVQAR
ncbi:acyltransferase family protein [Mycolicibacterium hippocampi]|uniref:acyltransferase family protein n=1 Tax=Mycolicibacterium hippocampi TaxID=659824 RepID=UPI0015B6B1A1|nr:acyltransferase [Mycolicibacterium hippocampi]